LKWLSSDKTGDMVRVFEPFNFVTNRLIVYDFSTCQNIITTTHQTKINYARKCTSQRLRFLISSVNKRLRFSTINRLLVFEEDL